MRHNPYMIESYQNLLLQELDLRKSRRKAYSVRAFARDLAISPSYLSLLFKGKRVLDLSRAFAICERLTWDRQKAKLFTLLVQHANARTDYERKTLTEEIDELRNCIHRFELPLDGVLDQVKGFKEFKNKVLPVLTAEGIFSPLFKDIVITIFDRKTSAKSETRDGAVGSCYSPASLLDSAAQKDLA